MFPGMGDGVGGTQNKLCPSQFYLILLGTNLLTPDAKPKGTFHIKRQLQCPSTDTSQRGGRAVKKRHSKAAKAASIRSIAAKCY